jgi:hypothetical protein
MARIHLVRNAVSDPRVLELDVKVSGVEQKLFSGRDAASDPVLNVVVVKVF